MASIAHCSRTSDDRRIAASSATTPIAASASTAASAMTATAMTSRSSTWSVTAIVESGARATALMPVKCMPQIARVSSPAPSIWSRRRAARPAATTAAAASSTPTSTEAAT